jgi:hypothetical protein
MFQIPQSNMIIKLKASFRSHIQLAFRRLWFPFSSFSSHIQLAFLRLGFPLSSFKKNRVEGYDILYQTGMLEQSQTEIRALWQLKERAPGFESTRAHGYGLWAKENQTLAMCRRNQKNPEASKDLSTNKEKHSIEVVRRRERLLPLQSGDALMNQLCKRTPSEDSSHTSS